MSSSPRQSRGDEDENDAQASERAEAHPRCPRLMLFERADQDVEAEDDSSGA
jgi:hypothetical protein